MAKHHFGTKEILASRRWSVEVFNNGSHLRLNGVVDVWPSSCKWLAVTPSRRRKAEVYYTLDELAAIVSRHEKEVAGTPPTASSFKPATLPPPPPINAKKPMPKSLTWAEFAAKFGDEPKPPAPKKLLSSKAFKSPPADDSPPW